jgi:hypothetical protein
MAFFAGTQIIRFGIPRMTGYTGGLVSVALVVVQMMMAVDAYFIARSQLKEAFGPAPERPVPITTSRVPAFVPIGLACIFGAGFFLAMIVGLAIQAARGTNGKASTLATQNRLQSRRGEIGAQSGSVLPATDFLPAVEEVRKIERKTHRSKDDLQDLKRDAQILAAELKKQRLTADDAPVAHFYKGLSLSLINSIHDHEGEAVEMDGERIPVGFRQRGRRQPAYLHPCSELFQCGVFRRVGCSQSITFHFSRVQVLGKVCLARARWVSERPREFSDHRRWRTESGCPRSTRPAHNGVQHWNQVQVRGRFVRDEYRENRSFHRHAPSRR